MFEETLSKRYMVIIQSSSKGTQRKYKKGNYWYKEDTCGDEGLVEYLVSKVLQSSSLDPEEYVIYEDGLINGKKGCRSLDFTHNGKYSFITLERAYSKLTFKSLSDYIYAAFRDEKERYNYVVDWFKTNYQYDLTRYFSKIFTLDMITLNDDRHFNNLGFLFSEHEIKDAPIFDNGRSLLNGLYNVDRLAPMYECVEHSIARPFSGSHEIQCDLGEIGFSIDYSDLYNKLAVEKDSFYKKVLLYQLNKYKSIFDVKMDIF